MRLNFVVKLCAVILILTAFLFSCKKADTETPSYTPENEAALISAWKTKMKEGKVVYDSTATKIYYILDATKVGSGSNVAQGNKVTVSYSGRFLDGTLFDYSDSFTYVHKSSGQKMIPGWEEAIELLNKGSRGAFLIPSSLAYGPTGYYSIPPYCPLMFTIEIVDIQ